MTRPTAAQSGHDLRVASPGDVYERSSHGVTWNGTSDTKTTSEPVYWPLEEQRILRNPAPAQRAAVGIERETLDHVQLIAVGKPAVGGKNPRLESNRVDNQHVAVPAPDRVSGAARGDVGWMLAQVQYTVRSSPIEP